MKTRRQCPSCHSLMRTEKIDNIVFFKCANCKTKIREVYFHLNSYSPKQQAQKTGFYGA